MKPSILYIVILILIAIVVFQAIRAPHPDDLTPFRDTIQAQKHTIDSLTAKGVQLEQDALKASVMAKEGVRRADSIEGVYLRQKQALLKMGYRIPAGDQVEILKEHLK